MDCMSFCSSLSQLCCEVANVITKVLQITETENYCHQYERSQHSILCLFVTKYFIKLLSYSSPVFDKLKIWKSNLKFEIPQETKQTPSQLLL